MSYFCQGSYYFSEQSCRSLLVTYVLIFSAEVNFLTKCSIFENR